MPGKRVCEGEALSVCCLFVGWVVLALLQEWRDVVVRGIKVLCASCATEVFVQAAVDGERASGSNCFNCVRNSLNSLKYFRTRNGYWDLPPKHRTIAIPIANAEAEIS